MSTHSSRGGSWGPKSIRMSSGLIGSQYGPYGGEHLNRQMDPLIGQSITSFKPNSIITYGSQTNGPYLPRGPRPTVFGTQAQLPTSQNPNSTNSSSQNLFSEPKSATAYKKLIDVELQFKIEKSCVFDVMRSFLLTIDAKIRSSKS